MRVFDAALRALGRLRLWHQFVALGLFVVLVPIVTTSRRFLDEGRDILTRHEIIDLSDEANLRVNEIRADFDALTRDVAGVGRALSAATQAEAFPEALAATRLAALTRDWQRDIPAAGQAAASVAQVRRRYFAGCWVESHAVAVERRGAEGPVVGAVSLAVVGADGEPLPAGRVDGAVAGLLRDLAERACREPPRTPTYVSDFALRRTDPADPRCLVAVGWPARRERGRVTHLLAVVVDFTRYLDARRATSPRHHYIVTQPDGTLLVHSRAELVARGDKLPAVAAWDFPRESAWADPTEVPEARARRFARMLQEGGSRLDGVRVDSLATVYCKGQFGNTLHTLLGERADAAIATVAARLHAAAAADPGLRYGVLTPAADYVELAHADPERLRVARQTVEGWWRESAPAGKGIDWIEPLNCVTFQGQLTYLQFDPSDDGEPPRLVVAAALEELHEDIDTQFGRIVWRWVVPTVAIAAFSTVLLVVILTQSLRRLADTANTLANTSSPAPIVGGGSREVTQLAAALDGMVTQLESRVRVRTAELAEANTKLEVALRQAEAAARAKDTFLANMSHELRQPLHIVIGFAEALREEAADAGDAALGKDLAKILAAARHLLELINDILDLAKIAAGKLELAVHPFAVRGMLDEVRTLVEPLAGKNRNAFVLDAPGDLGTMTTDERRVRQVLLNLLSNAFKFTEAGTVTLAVRGVTVGSRELVEFAVGDTGKGMSPDQLARLFQRFYQADDATTRVQGGTGLGLAITQSFAEVMGAEPIEVTSLEGQGSRFVVRLPRVAEPTPARATPRALQLTEAAASAESVAAPPAGDVVLVIDDDPAVQELMTRFLAKEGFAVRCATTGAEGLALARSLRPAAVTLDVMMAGLDGWATLASLKADPATCDVPVVLLTIVDDRGRGFALGAADYLTKPIDWPRLTAILRRTRTPPGRPVLVVDDDAESRAVIRRHLEREGWRVTEAADGEAALLAVARETPALVLLDLMMPVLDGFGFLAELPARFPGLPLPVVVLTAKELAAADFDRLNGRVARILAKGDLRHFEQMAALVKSLARRDAAANA